MLPTVDIHIATQNRCAELRKTLEHLNAVVTADNVQIVVFNDGSVDDTFNYLNSLKGSVKVHHRSQPRGVLYARNYMMNESTADYVISLDDDAHFISKTPIKDICHYFDSQPLCAIMAFKIWWSKDHNAPVAQEIDGNYPVQSFVGCGHAWRRSAWQTVPDYPEWFEFYGEEQFASLQLLKLGWQVHYTPQITVQHRVDLKERQKDVGAQRIRSVKHLKSGWFNYFLFFPIDRAFYLFFKSIGLQLLKPFKYKSLVPLVVLVKALFQSLLAIRKLIIHRKPLSRKRYMHYLELPKTMIYWNP